MPSFKSYFPEANLFNEFISQNFRVKETKIPYIPKKQKNEKP